MKLPGETSIDSSKILSKFRPKSTRARKSNVEPIYLRMCNKDSDTTVDQFWRSMV